MTTTTPTVIGGYDAGYSRDGQLTGTQMQAHDYAQRDREQTQRDTLTGR